MKNPGLVNLNVVSCRLLGPGRAMPSPECHPSCICASKYLISTSLNCLPCLLDSFKFMSKKLIKNLAHRRLPMPALKQQYRDMLIQRPYFLFFKYKIEPLFICVGKRSSVLQAYKHWLLLFFGSNEKHPSSLLLFQRDDMEAVPGYLSLHQTADIMTLKWTPNQLMNGSVGDLDYERRCRLDDIRNPPHAKNI